MLFSSRRYVFPWHPFPYQIHFSMFSLYDVDVRPESGDPSVNSTVKKNLQDFVALYISTGACRVTTFIHLPQPVLSAYLLVTLVRTW
jgi:hypothetical protein